MSFLEEVLLILFNFMFFIYLIIKSDLILKILRLNNFFLYKTEFILIDNKILFLLKINFYYV